MSFSLDAVKTRSVTETVALIALATVMAMTAVASYGWHRRRQRQAAASRQPTNDNDDLVETSSLGAQAGAGEARAGDPLRVPDSLHPLGSFRYLGDLLFLGGCSFYGLNRWVLKPRIPSEFLHSYFNDVLLIPCALPPLLALQRLLGLRRHDAPPTWGEIAGHLIVWSILFEAIGPYLFPHTTGDPWDVVCYTVGGTVAGWWWNRGRRIPRQTG